MVVHQQEKHHDSCHLDVSSPSESDMDWKSEPKLEPKTEDAANVSVETVPDSSDEGGKEGRDSARWSKTKYGATKEYLDHLSGHTVKERHKMPTLSHAQ